MGYMPGDKLGEYIHYKYENYMRYGLARKLSASSASQGSLSKYAWEARQEASAFLQRSSSRQSLAQMEQYLKYLMGEPQQEIDANFTPEQRIAMQETLVESLSNKVKNLSVGDIDWSTLTLTAQGREKAKSGKIDLNKMKNLLGDTKMLRLQTLRKQLQMGSQGFNIKSFLTRIANVQAAIQSLELGQQSLDKLMTKIRHIKMRLGDTTSGRFQDASLHEDLLKIVKEAIALYSITKLEGDLAEHAVSAIGAAFTSQVGSNTKQLIEQGVVGSNKEKNVFITNQFMKGIDIKTVMQNSSYRLSEDGITWEITGGTDGKVDASIKINDSIITSSVKNYDFSSANPKVKSVSLVSGTNMLFLLSNKARFLNHYLNQSVDTAPDAVAQAANEQMKVMILLLAFTGGGTRKNKSGALYENRADVFVINDKSQKYGIRVVSIYDLFEKIVLTPSLYSGVEVNFNSSHRWKNKFYGESAGGYEILDPRMADKRISNILAQVHSYKIKASIGLGTMKQALNTI